MIFNSFIYFQDIWVIGWGQPVSIYTVNTRDM